ncbi:MAG: hypothetical protein LQ343_003478 [Gyalolechia ehrenbergii]|nr:MAG: hypothetical protein LQ343_003478 [Gyalolechia ehrenbergii]
MDIHNMLNNKGSAAAVAAAAAAVSDQQLTQHVAHAFSAPNAANVPSDSDGVSDHSPEYASRTSRPTQALPYPRAQIHQSSQALMSTEPDWKTDTRFRQVTQRIISIQDRHLLLALAGPGPGTL